MPASKTSVTSYLAGLPAGPRAVLSAVRDTIRKNLPLDAIGESVARIPVDEYIRRYKSVKRK